MRLLNADGSPSEVSGNGLRCLAAWIARSEGLKRGARVVIHTDAGAKTLELLEENGERLTFVAEMGEPTELRQISLAVAGQNVTAVVMRVGNPQCVVLGPATPERLAALGLALATHSLFPAGTNVELAEVTSPTTVRILIWERGVGPTESSGTGTCAAAVAASAFGGAGRTLDVTSPGGTQRVEWTDAGLRLTGWAELVGHFEWWLA
jgi:diaminopimelate epimerase